MDLSTHHIKIKPAERQGILDFSQGLHMAVIFLSLDFRVLDYNAVAQNIYAWKKEDILNKSYLAWCKLHKKVPVLSLKEKDRIAHGAPISSIEIAEGARTTTWNIIYNLDENNTPRSVVLIGRETAQKNAPSSQIKKRIQKKEVDCNLPSAHKNSAGNPIDSNAPENTSIKNEYSYLENIISTMPCYVYWKDKHFIYRGCNDLAAKNLNLRSRKEIIGMTDYDFGWKKEETEAFRKIDKKIIKTGKPYFKIEETLTFEGYDPKYLIGNKMPIFDEHNQIIGIAGISFDITEQKLAEAKLKEELAQLSKNILGSDIGSHRTASDHLATVYSYLENIIAAMPCYVYWKDKNFVYLGCNDLSTQLVNLRSRKDIIGMTDYDFGWKKEEVDTYRKVDEQIIKTGQPYLNIEETVMIEGHDPIHLLVNKMPLFDKNNQVTGIVGISVDITKEKQTQEALKQSNRARLEFISTASHEVINHVSCAVMLAERLRENLLTLQDILPEKMNEGAPAFRILTETLEHCEDIRSATEGSMTVIKNLSALHHMQLTGVTACPAFFDIQKFVDIAIKKSTYPNTNHITVEKYISPTVPQGLIMDASNMIQALSIVIGNAFRFSRPEGKIKITIKKLLDNKEPWLAISVQDFGVGMHQKQIDNLSKTLLSEKESLFSKPSVQLSRVKMYLEAYQGRLEIESVVGQGTEVRLIMAYQPSLSKHIQREETIHPRQQKNREVKKQVMRGVHEPICTVLLVEDDIVTQKITAQILLELGYQVDVAKDGAEAIQMAIIKDYAIALLDITLPDINGLDVMREIRASKGEETIFIALSSHTSEEEEEYFMNEGVMALLAKPVKIKQLKSVLDSALEVKARLRENEGDV
jgi:two-component system aerobic respiration control sensor histidine kinase ArcB